MVKEKQIKNFLAFINGMQGKTIGKDNQDILDAYLKGSLTYEKALEKIKDNSRKTINDNSV